MRGNKDNYRGWIERFQELQSYKTMHGHCNVPTMSWTLGRWVNRQRTQYRLLKERKTFHMTDGRVQNLESIGFQWSYHSWDCRFQELQLYKAEHRHCNVPIKSGTLGQWVRTQRTQYRFLKEGKTSFMIDERMKKLETISFQWSLGSKYHSWDYGFRNFSRTRLNTNIAMCHAKEGYLDVR